MRLVGSKYVDLRFFSSCFPLFQFVLIFGDRFPIFFDFPRDFLKFQRVFRIFLNFSIQKKENFVIF